ncbi:MAG TPA: ABC transporter permease [Oligoflexus sp.]|uniref:ABC transporter permease n=1 Tax=Oligoflexus sp. TaxID=1971216 RepID=UPI002D7E8C24|nr:ABC transporter permease [Oligoflexus sp.]HET9235935.1 ABC transporter permease [Oligoflexus sp.]
MLGRLLSQKKSLWGLAILIFFALLTILGPFFTVDPRAFLGTPLQPPSQEFWLGTTGQGQDVWAQMVVGGRHSLFSALAIGAGTTLIGALLGLAAAYWGGLVDEVISLVSNIFLVIPGLPLAIVVAAYLPSGTLTIALVLIATGWAWNARVFRAQALSLRQRDFVAAAIVGGESSLRLMLFEILPNMASLLLSTFLGAMIYALGAQVGLEFLGLGDISAITWGTNLYWASNDAALMTESWWTFVPTGVCIALLGFALALLNFAIDEIADPRLQVQKAWRRRVGHADPGLTPVVRTA